MLFLSHRYVVQVVLDSNPFPLFAAWRVLHFYTFCTFFLFISVGDLIDIDKSFSLSLVASFISLLIHGFVSYS